MWFVLIHHFMTDRLLVGGCLGSRDIHCSLSGFHWLHRDGARYFALRDLDISTKSILSPGHRPAETAQPAATRQPRRAESSSSQGTSKRPLSATRPWPLPAPAIQFQRGAIRWKPEPSVPFARPVLRAGRDDGSRRPGGDRQVRNCASAGHHPGRHGRPSLRWASSQIGHRTHAGGGG